MDFVLDLARPGHSSIMTWNGTVPGAKPLTKSKASCPRLAESGALLEDDVDVERAERIDHRRAAELVEGSPLSWTNAAFCASFSTMRSQRSVFQCRCAVVQIAR